MSVAGSTVRIYDTTASAQFIKGPCGVSGRAGSGSMGNRLGGWAPERVWRPFRGPFWRVASGSGMAVGRAASK